MGRVLFLFLLCLYLKFPSPAQRIEVIGVPNANPSPFLLSGAIFDVYSGDLLPGANIYLEKQETGTSSDLSGNYELQLPLGVYTIAVSYAGYNPKIKTINLQGNGKLNIGLQPSITSLDEIVVTSDEYETLVDQKAGLQTLSVEKISELPNIGGEVDVVRSLTLLPGVSTTGEATGGFNVRGGNFDQNLLLIQGATLFNASHLFGFVSALNPSVVRSVNLYKGYIPATFGGRGSSVLEINEKRGSLTQWEGDASLGMLSARLGVGGPIIPKKMSVMVGLRQSYVNWLFKRAREGNINNSQANFNDYNVILAYAINDKNDLQISTYRSSDNFEFATNTANSWINQAHSLRYSSVIRDYLTLNLTGNIGQYTSTIDDRNEFTGSSLETGIIKRRFDINSEIDLSSGKSVVGVEFVDFDSDPGKLTSPEGSSIQPDVLDQQDAHLWSMYVDNELSISNLSISAGLRFSTYTQKGTDTVSIYEPGLARRTQNIIDSEIRNGTIINYSGFEPRLGINYKISDSQSIKASYIRMLQYVHLVSNTAAIAPTDQWKLSDTFLRPQTTEQFTLGFFFNKGLIEASIEGYYKRFTDLLEYKDGADLFANQNIETEVFQGDGTSFGLELFVEKSVGRLNGWMSYTFSRSLRRSRSPFPTETINDGQIYPTNFDQPHNLSLVMNYKLGPVTTFSSTFSYQSGRPATFPNGRVRLSNNVLGYFPQRNNGRIPDYHRLDIAFKFHWPSKHLILDGDWVLSIYNLYGRDNAFSIFFKDPADGPPEAFQLTVVGSAFPSLSYNFKF